LVILSDEDMFKQGIAGKLADDFGMEVVSKLHTFLPINTEVLK